MYICVHNSIYSWDRGCECACAHVCVIQLKSWQWKFKGCNLKMSLPFGHISRIIYNIWLFNFLFPFFFFLLDCIVDCDNELSILFITEEEGGSRAASGTTVELWLQAAPHKLSLKAHSFKKRNVGLVLNFPPTFTFRTPTETLRPLETLSPSATASSLSRSRLKDESKKEETNTTNRDSVQGSKGNQEKCCFHFLFFFERRPEEMDGCYRFLFTDGWHVM